MRAAIRNDLDTATAQRTRDRKLKDSCIAVAAIHGVVVVESTDDRGRQIFVVSLGAWTRQITGLQALVDWVSRVHGRRVEVGP